MIEKVMTGIIEMIEIEKDQDLHAVIANQDQDHQLVTTEETTDETIEETTDEMTEEMIVDEMTVATMIETEKITVDVIVLVTGAIPLEEIKKISNQVVKTMKMPKNRKVIVLKDVNDILSKKFHISYFLRYSYLFL